MAVQGDLGPAPAGDLPGAEDEMFAGFLQQLQNMNNMNPVEKRSSLAIISRNIEVRAAGALGDAAHAVYEKVKGRGALPPNVNLEDERVALLNALQQHMGNGQVQDNGNMQVEEGGRRKRRRGKKTKKSKKSRRYTRRR